MKWFDVDKAGLAKLLAKRGKEFILFELIQNTWDEATTKVIVTLVREGPKSRNAVLTVEDDNPNGFVDLTHAFTLFAESTKKANAEKRGRFNLGEKLVLALCEEAEIVSTTGAVRFDKDGRHTSRKRRERGSIFTGVIRMTDEEMQRCGEMVQCLIPPDNIITIYNDQPIAFRKPVSWGEKSLPTEIADSEGFMRKRQRMARVEIYDPQPGEFGTLYEMGIPVVETGDRWHVNVFQKVPLNLDRDNVPPSFISAVRAIALDWMHASLTVDDVNTTWVKDAFQKHGDKLSPVTINQVTDLRFGPKRVSFDPSDPEANQLAVSQGFTLVHGGSMSGQEWDAVRRAGAILPAGQVTPSPKPYHPDGTPLTLIPRAQWAPAVTLVVNYMETIGRQLVGTQISTDVTNDPTWPFRATYGPGHLTLNLGALGIEFFMGPLTEINHLLIHELGHHFSGNHLSSDFHESLCRLGAKLADLVLNMPHLFKSVVNGLLVSTTMAH